MHLHGLIDFKSFFAEAQLSLDAHEKKIGHRDCSRWAHGEFTVNSLWPKWSQPAVTWAVIELWLSRDHRDWAVTELWPSRDWAVTSPWLSCDLA